jgi:transposase InsO family protein
MMQAAITSSGYSNGFAAGTLASLALPANSGLVAGACAALGLARASVYRARAHLLLRPPPSRPARLPPPRALGPEERSRVLDLLRTPRFVDLAPAEIYATLLDEGVYLCSIRTLYRILAENGEVRERRDQLRHPVYQKPELLADAPNQVWSWDITKLMGPAKWSYFYLYVILDIFSRRVVGWCVADAENSTSSSISSAAASSAGVSPMLKTPSCSRPCLTTPLSSMASHPVN